MAKQSPWMTRAETAAYMRVSIWTIDAWRRAGMPFTRRGRRVLINRDRLEDFLTRQEQDRHGVELPPAA